MPITQIVCQKVVKILFQLFFLFATTGLSSQTLPFKPHFYDLKMVIDTENHQIHGANTIHFVTKKAASQLQVQLDTHYTVDSVLLSNHPVDWSREDSAIIIGNLSLDAKDVHYLKIVYHGKPPIADNPPWKGGFTWSQDSLGHPWVGVTCQHEGAHRWWPVVDNWKPRPDSMRLTFGTPAKDVQIISNGSFVDSFTVSGIHYFQWMVHYPVTPYNATFYLGAFSHFKDTLANGIDVDFYPLLQDSSEAMKHFAQVPEVLVQFEQLFGAYPFPRDGYAYVQSPYWGMEHQSAIAYGNNFKNNMMGYDFIIVHESAHEYWGNSLTAASPQDFWIHEAFATYSERLFLEQVKGNRLAVAYFNQQRERITLKEPLILPEAQSIAAYTTTDIYYKGAWLLHTLRLQVGDSTFMHQLKSLQVKYRHGYVTTKTVIDHFQSGTSQNLLPIFQHYLYKKELPLLLLRKKDSQLQAKWKNVSDDFRMKIGIYTADQTTSTMVSTQWSKLSISDPKLINFDSFLSERTRE